MSEKENVGMDITQLAALMDMIQGMSAPKTDDVSKQTEIAAASEPPRISALKAAMPHMPLKNQRNLAISIKMLEIKEICRHYDEIEAQSTPDPNWRRKALAATAPYLDEKKQRILRSYIQIMEMQEMIKNIEKFKEMNV